MDEFAKECYTKKVPTSKSKCFKETQFSGAKYRDGFRSMPFLGLPAGTHKVRFYDEKNSKIIKVKVWLSMYGWAWECVNN